MEQGIIFDFCSLFDMEQGKDIDNYLSWQTDKVQQYKSIRI